MPIGPSSSAASRYGRSPGWRETDTPMRMAPVDAARREVGGLEVARQQPRTRGVGGGQRVVGGRRLQRGDVHGCESRCPAPRPIGWGSERGRARHPARKLT